MMAGIILNARGSGNSETIARIHQLSNLHRCQFFAILEPMISAAKLGEVCRATGFHHFMANSASLPKICMFWKNSFQLTCLVSHEQSLTFALGRVDDPVAYISIVYAKCLVTDRRSLWNHLSSFASSISLPWIVGGDFNALTSASEKRGGAAPNRGSMEDFQNLISAASLMDAGYEGSIFTWWNGQQEDRSIFARLDRCLYNVEWLNYFPSTKVVHLARQYSDHSPLLLSFYDSSSMGRDQNHSGFRICGSDTLLFMTF